GTELGDVRRPAREVDDAGQDGALVETHGTCLPAGMRQPSRPRRGHRDGSPVNGQRRRIALWASTVTRIDDATTIPRIHASRSIPSTPSTYCVGGRWSAATCRAIAPTVAQNRNRLDQGANESSERFSVRALP